MHSWIFRNRRRLEAIYGGPGRSRPRHPPTAAPDAAARAGSAARTGVQSALRLVVYELIPRARRKHAA